ncbi:hypothetical protein [Vibrio sp. PID23_8]|uniref:hypothetical protein n=1 Tax=Vibrio sp. PID23_8 TaxID=1583767 RepID=UPI001603DE3F|nr:hypothetical protein [Vibrio sp. PID23_8]
MTLFTLPVIVSDLSAFAPQVAKWIAGDKAEYAAKAVLDVAQTVTGIRASDHL